MSDNINNDTNDGMKMVLCWLLPQHPFLHHLWVLQSILPSLLLGRTSVLMQLS